MALVAHGKAASASTSTGSAAMRPTRRSGPDPRWQRLGGLAVQAVEAGEPARGCNGDAPGSSMPTHASTVVGPVRWARTVTATHVALVATAVRVSSTASIWWGQRRRRRGTHRNIRSPSSTPAAHRRWPAQTPEVRRCPRTARPTIPFAQLGDKPSGGDRRRPVRCRPGPSALPGSSMVLSAVLRALRADVALGGQRVVSQVSRCWGVRAVSCAAASLRRLLGGGVQVTERTVRASADAVAVQPGGDELRGS